MPKSRAAKEICREDPDGISCKVATNRERRRKKRSKMYGEDEKPKAEAKETEEKSEPKEDQSELQRIFDRKSQLKRQEEQAGL